MNIIRKNIFVLLLAGITPVFAQDVLHSKKGKWEVQITDRGTIESLSMDFGGSQANVPWHGEGQYAGPYLGCEFHKADALTYKNSDGEVEKTLRYADEEGRLTLLVSLRNKTNRRLTIDRASLRLGIDHVMHDPKTYYSVFFPTMLRAEKTHLWGYFQSPDGKVLAIASSDSIASWHIDYIGNGHRIGTSELDLMQKGPLPDRHPQNLYTLEPNEEKQWKLVFLPVTSIKEVFRAVAMACGIPTVELSQTTAASGENIRFKIHSLESEHVKAEVLLSDKYMKSLSITINKDGEGYYSFTAPEKNGLYKIKVTDGKHTSEAEVYVRKPWSWYLQQARNESMRMEQKTAMHREAWMGFFSEYWAQVYQPDSAKLADTERRFNAFWQMMIDQKTGFYYTNRQTWSSRPQNTSWMIGVLSARYAATKNIKNLELAAQWADFLISKFQLPDGAYKGYTALTMGAKFLQDLLWQEYPFAQQDAVWRERYERHKRSVEAAALNLLKVGDMGETEGESTYEDTQAGSAWSLLAMHALVDPSSYNYKKFLKESLAIQGRHECLTQALVPDGRMRGGTLRWWEAQYDVLIRRNFMNSPHGWTMRSQFGALYLYLLTGNEYFLDVAYNSMASCAQAIDDHTGELRWGFVPDPYIEAERFVQDYRHPGEGKYVKEVIGEQWLPMISSWWRTPEGKIPGNRQPGWSCDNDVHEHFRFMAEEFIPNAFVKEMPGGSFRTWNCTVETRDGKLFVTPADGAVTRVHFNLRSSHTVSIAFNKGLQTVELQKGMQWAGPGMKHYAVPAVYLWQEMIGNTENIQTTKSR